MQISVETTEGLERKMTVIVPNKDANAEMTKRLKGIAKDIKMDGFRPGKVPFRIVKQRFSAHVKEEIRSDVIQKTFYDAIGQEKIQLVGTAKKVTINDSDDDVISYTAIFDVMPDVELADISDVTIEKATATVTDDDIETMINQLREQKLIWNETDEAAKDGDRLNIDFKGYIDGELFEGGTAKDVMVTLGSGQMITGFEAALIGFKKGDNKTISVDFPDDYQVETLAGKAATFDIVVNTVESSTLPEIDETFIKEFGIESGNKDDFMQDIRKNMEFELKQKLKSRLKDNITKMLLKQHELEVPQAVIEMEAEALKEQTLNKMKAEGRESQMNLPASIFESQAKERVILGLIMSEFAKTAEIKLDSERVSAMIKEYASAYEDPQALITHYETDAKARQPIENLVLEEQIIDHVLSLVKTEDKAMSFKALMDS